MNLTETFSAINEQMIIDFEKKTNQLEHLGDRGVARENILKDFLDQYLPKKYAISKGEIVDSEGNRSKQCDLIIYDHLSCPILYVSKDSQIFPAESVYAVIQVKSVLNTHEVESSINNIKSVKMLNRENGPIAGIVFGYKTDTKTNPMVKLSERIRKINASDSANQYVDLWTVLNNGLICLIGEEEKVTANQERERIMLTYLELGDPPVLLWFYTYLLELLNEQKIASPNLVSYSHVIDIGTIVVYHNK